MLPCSARNFTGLDLSITSYVIDDDSVQEVEEIRVLLRQFI